MNNKSGIKKTMITVCIIVVSLCLVYVMMFFLYKDKQNVMIQDIDDEVNLDSKACTDGQADCHKNINFFDNTWFQVGEDNFDPIKLPQDIFKGDQAQE